MGNKNPWKGVVPYTDEPNELSIYPFKGRDVDIEKLYSMISNNTIVTLYGRSGIGKTSLLKAGLFPKLKKESYVPVYVRLGRECTFDDSFAEYIVDKLKQDVEVKPLDNLVIPDAIKEDRSRDNIDFLWSFFAYHSFFQNGQEVIPVVVLDQFEEILRVTDAKHKEKALLLIQQIRATLQNGFLVDGTKYSIAFRFVFSLREDDLFLLEDLLDQNHIDSMKKCRYRLCPICKEAAKEIIFIDRSLFPDDEEERNKVAGKLIEYSDESDSKEYDEDNAVISTLLLSLVCSLAYEASDKGIITYETVTKRLSNNPLLSFYKDAIKGLKVEVVAWIEESFVDNGRRRSVFVSEIPDEFRPSIELLKSEDNPNRIFTDTSKNKTKQASIELIHDKLVDAINENKYSRLKDYADKRSKKNRIRGLVLCISLVLFVLFCVYVGDLTKKPIDFSSVEKVSQGGIVPVSSRPYGFPDGVLSLKNCVVLPYTFYNNKDIDYIYLDSVVLQSPTSLYAPNARVLELGGGQYLFFDNITENQFPNVSDIIVHRPTASIAVNSPVLFSNNLNKNNVIIDIDDASFVKWHQDALFVRKDIDSSWICLLKFRNKVFYNPDTITVVPNSSLVPLLEVVITEEGLPNMEILRNKYGDLFSKGKIKLIYNVPQDTILTKQTVAEMMKNLPREKIISIECPYIKRIADSAFFRSRNIESISFPKAMWIGDCSFWGCGIERVYLPCAEIIGANAFYSCNAITSIVMRNVRIIGNDAFASCSNIDTLIIPSVDTIKYEAFFDIKSNAYCMWNPSAYIENRVWGYKNIIPNNHMYIPNVELINIADVSTSDPGYRDSGDSIIIYSMNVPYLEIGPNIKHIVLDRKKLPYGAQVDAVKIDRKNQKYYLWRGDVYYENYLILQTNRKKYVSASMTVSYDSCLSTCDNRKFHDYYAIYRNDNENVRFSGNNHSVLHVPYGQLDVFGDDYASRFSSVEEMTVFGTLWYRFFYKHPQRPYAWMGFFKESSFANITLSYVALILLMWLLWCYRLKSNNKKEWLSPLFVGLIILLVGAIFYVLANTDYYWVRFSNNKWGLFFNRADAWHYCLKRNVTPVEGKFWSGFVIKNIWVVHAICLVLWLIYIEFLNKKST